ncbi:MAG: hypothetical protein JJU35_02235 [Balneolales bacterium]|nr:hypothetical protein [Balneolales bacterium]
MEFLIILFIIYSFFQWLLGDKKKQQELKRRRQQQQMEQEQDPRFDNPRTARQQEERREPQSWEDAMKELESIFSPEPVETAEERRAREEAEYRRPEPQPVFSPQPKPSDNPFMAHAGMSSSRSSNRRAEPGLRELEEAGDNPIFQKTDVAYDVYNHTAGTGSRHTTGAVKLLKDQDSNQMAIILKEILDKPLSRRRHEVRIF